MAGYTVNFPSQAVSDLEKMSQDYGLEVAKAIKQEWFYDSRSKFNTNLNNFHKLRLYARGWYVWNNVFQRYIKRLV